jgi:hypothetical protein
VPVFVIGYLLIYLFAIRLEWLPVQGYKSLSGPSAAGPWAWMRQLILPWMTLAMIYVALIARVTRASVSEALTEDYIRTARAKGITESAVLLRHALGQRRRSHCDSGGYWHCLADWWRGGHRNCVRYSWFGVTHGGCCFEPRLSSHSRLGVVVLGQLCAD